MIRKKDDFLFVHNGTHYDGVSKIEIQDQIRPTIVGAMEKHAIMLQQLGLKDSKAHSVTDSMMNNVFSALRSKVPKVKADAPCWLSDDGDATDPTAIVPVSNGLLSVDSGELLPHTPKFFNLWSLPYKYDRSASVPPIWEDFLNQTFDGDQERIDLLQEWFGYCLVGDISFEKFLWLWGPPASGKGTIASVLQALVTDRNIAAVDIYNLDSRFAFDGVLGKSLLLLNEAQDNRRRDLSGPVVNVIKMITGRDMVRVEGKSKGSVSLVLPIKIMGVSNDLPVFRDASNAINRRLLMLPCDNPLRLGEQDGSLKHRLMAGTNLPGIFNWSVQGLTRLREQGAFTVPTVSREIEDELRMQGSPCKAFVETCLERDRNGWESTADLYDAFLRFAEQHDLNAVDRNIFCKNLRSAVSVRPARRGPKGDQCPGYQGVTLKADFRKQSGWEQRSAEPSTI